MVNIEKLNIVDENGEIIGEETRENIHIMLIAIMIK